MKQAKKILSVLLAVLLLASCLPMAASAAGETPYTAGAPAGGSYTISTAEQLKALADAVNGGEPYKNTTFTLTQDIDLSSVCSPYLNGGTNWEPIGMYFRSVEFTDKPFSGTFDGGGHTVSGLYIDRQYYELALFGFLLDGTVKHLRVSGEVTAIGNVSGVVGRNLGTVEDCINLCTINGIQNPGGIVGDNRGTVKNCINRGSVNGHGIFGGIAGINYGTVTDCRNTGDVIGDGDIGGIVGGNPGTIAACTNEGRISGESYIGGIVGNSAGTVKNCRNIGTVSGISEVGGVVGWNSGTVEKCYNVGTLEGSMSNGGYVGGVIGTNLGTVTDCYNTASVRGNFSVGGVAGRIDGILECCYSIGEITSADFSPEEALAGGVAGGSLGTLKNCYYLLGTATKGIGDDRGSGMAVGLTAEAFAKKGSFAGWDFSNTWGMSTDAADQRPVLRAIPEHEYQSGSAPVESSFTDVSPAAYYAVPVAWAVKQEITDGTGGGKFSPNAVCTRAQAMTLLWKAMGSPSVSTENSFSDVPDDAYYCNAVNWAVANGITSGTGDGKFSPHAACTRAQILTFLWKAAGSQTIGDSVFSDVPAAAYCSKAVSWAVANGITAGTGDGKFSPDQTCTRAQIVTFLWHNMGE